MKKRVFKTTAFVVLATMLAMTVAQGLAPAQELNLENAEHFKGNKAIQGTWQVQVTIVNCMDGNPIATFPSLVTYNGGGTMMESTSSIRPAFRYPGQGVWHYVGAQRFAASFMFFRFNPDGSFAGTQKITQDIEYDRDLDQLNITATFEVLDLNGNVVGTGCVTVVGTRFEV